MKPFYLTTPLYYVNDVPHIGHAYTTIAADVLARWRRLNGDAVFFLTGTDEHGAKIAKAAEATGEAPQTFVNRIAGEYRKVWTALGISYDDFIEIGCPKMPSPRGAGRLREIKSERQHLQRHMAEDWYCIHDESYFTDARIVQNAKCPTCGRDVQRLKKKTAYFFRSVGRTENQLLVMYYAAHPEFLSPETPRQRNRQLRQIGVAGFVRIPHARRVGNSDSVGSVAHGVCLVRRAVELHLNAGLQWRRPTRGTPAFRQAMARGRAFGWKKKFSGSTP